MKTGTVLVPELTHPDGAGSVVHGVRHEFVNELRYEGYQRKRGQRSAYRYKRSASECSSVVICITLARTQALSRPGPAIDIPNALSENYIL